MLPARCNPIFVIFANGMRLEYDLYTHIIHGLDGFAQRLRSEAANLNRVRARRCR